MLGSLRYGQELDADRYCRVLGLPDGYYQLQVRQL